MSESTPTSIRAVAGVRDAADLALRVVAGAILFAMMALTFVDVVLRYGFNSSIVGAFEITELMMVVLIFAGLPLVSAKDEHVVVDLIDMLLSSRVRAMLRVVGQLACTVVLAAMSWLLWRKAERVLGDGDVTAALQIVIWPFVYFMFVLTVVTTLIHLWKLGAAVRAAAAADR